MNVENKKSILAGIIGFFAIFTIKPVWDDLWKIESLLGSIFQSVKFIVWVTVILVCANQIIITIKNRK